MRQFGRSRAAAFILYFVLFWIAAAAAHSGFIGKWGLRDKSHLGFSIQEVLDGTAIQPVIYRQLVPLIVNFAESNTPGPIKNYIKSIASKPAKIFVRVPVSTDPNYHFRYILVYYINFFSLFLSLFVLNRILRVWGMPETTALLAPIMFVLATPYLQTRGGYFYDSVELLFFSTAFLLASHGRIPLLIALTIPATVNKETFLIFIPTLYPILRQVCRRQAVLVGLGIAMALSGSIGLTIKYIFRESRGSAVVSRFSDQVLFYLNPGNYFSTELTYGVVGPRTLFIGTLVFIVIVVARGWSSCNAALKRHLLIAAAINIPICLLFGYPGELRNLSLLYVGFVLLLGYALAGPEATRGPTIPADRMGSNRAKATAE